MALYITVSKHHSHMSVREVPALFVSRFLKLHPSASTALAPSGAAGLHLRDVHGPFDSSSLGAEADADTISMYLHKGITVKKVEMKSWFHSHQA